MKIDTISTEKYWASEENEEILLNSLKHHIRLYQEDLKSTNLLSLYETAYRAYYGGSISSASLSSPLFSNMRLNRKGSMGEKTAVKVNHYRNLVQHWVQLVTGQRKALRARARNSDYKSQAETILCNGLLDFYQKDKELENYIVQAAELAFGIYGEAFILEEWDSNAGDIVSAPMGEPIKTGELLYSVLTPLDVIRDFKASEFTDKSWTIVRKKRNRWEVIAENPSFEEAIKALNVVDTLDYDFKPEDAIRQGLDNLNSDYVYEYTLYHPRTSAMPDGAMVKFVNTAILFRGPLPFRDRPVRRLNPSSLAGSIYGFTLAWDLLSLQDGIDALHTVLMSNNKTFGIQSIWTRPGDAIQVQQLGKGLQNIKSAEEPKPIQLTKSAPESYNYLSILERSQENLSGISSTVRGNPEANLRTGNALALVVSQSIQFLNGSERAISKCYQEVGMDTVNILRDFTPDFVDRTITISGKSNKAISKTFNPKAALSNISSIIVEEVNPLSKTFAGRAEMANNLLQVGVIKSVEDYQQILTTGQLDSAFESDKLEQLAIQSENEALQEGLPVQAVLIENHPLHIRHHKAVIADPESKKNPALVQAVLQHIQEHMDLWRQMPPDLLGVLGMPPAMQPPAPVPQGNPGPVDSGAPQIAGVQLPKLPEGAPADNQKSYDSFKGGL